MMIDIDHVSFQYSGAERENLQDFNLQIEKGECVVLTGESGCGKTCVTRLINTLIPHFYEGEMSGMVLIDGVDTRTIQPHDLSDKTGSVFQNPRSQFFSLDTDSEIVFGMENKGMPYQVMLDRYQQTIRELHIEKLKDRNLFDLSGGQKQTIAFASVYALNPDIFVLDEPSSNLDPEAIQELRRLLLLIKAQGKTIIVSEHRLYFLNGIADRIVLMEHGRNPTRSNGNNLLHLVNKYMDLYQAHPDQLVYKARCEKYAKIISKTIILSGMDAASFGQNAYFYDAAEGLLTATILLVAEFCEPKKRHIVSVFKIIQELLAPSGKKGKNQFQQLMELLPNDHKAKWFAGAALNTAEQSMASVMSTALSRLNAFLDSELEQILCFDTEIDAEKFCKEKSALFIIMPEENPATFFMISLIIQQLYEEIAVREGCSYQAVQKSIAAALKKIRKFLK